jgi:Ca2+-binding EF-hand superfamily protein
MRMYQSKHFVNRLVRSFGSLFVSGVLVASSLPPLPPTLSIYDTDRDGTIDMNEAKAAALQLFDRLDTDKDGTLDMKELQGRLTDKEFSLADKDGDKTLTRDEYLSAVAKVFKAADRDHDGTLDAKELKTKAGESFLRLVN